MTPHDKILIAGEDVPTAEQLKKMLREEFKHISISTDPDQQVADFDRCRPSVLILAFNDLERAERYYLGLYRLSAAVHTLPHRNIVLCNKDNIEQVYCLCRDGHFDDYVLFWPLTYDTRRVFMAVHCALRELEGAHPGAPRMSEMATQARQVAELGTVLDESLVQGNTRAVSISRTMEQAEAEIGAAFDDFSNRLVEGNPAYALEGQSASNLQRDIQRLREEGVLQHFRTLNSAVEPMHLWVSELKQEVAPHLESARTLNEMAKRIRPVILIVDDDEFQCKVVAQLLQHANITLKYASSGVRALAAIRKQRPDLILMDFQMPDIDGIEVTRRLKSIKELASLPIIMISGQSRKSIVDASIKAGAADFIVKPFQRQDLFEKLGRFLGSLDT